MDIFSFCKTTKEEDGFEHTFRTMEALAATIKDVVAGADEIEHVRWQGIPDALSLDDPIPYADALAVDVSRHWHDGIPKIQLYGLRKTEDEEVVATYLYGLVPAEIDVSDECPNGIASAERDFPFLNMLVNTLTLGIYLPQHVTVTCAADGSMSAGAAPPARPFSPPRAPVGEQGGEQ